MNPLKLFFLYLIHIILIPSTVLSTNHRKCEHRHNIPNSETATITFDSERLSGHFVLYDNLRGSGTQIKGLFERGLVRKRRYPPNYMYKFVAFIKSTCDNLSENVFYQFEVTDSFIPKRKGLINERGGMDRIIKTTMLSWYWGPNVNIAVVGYENQAGIKKERWKKISASLYKSFTCDAFFSFFYYYILMIFFLFLFSARKL